MRIEREKNNVRSAEAAPSARDVERVLEQIDLEELAAIYREIAIKSGVLPEDIAPLTREHINVIANRDSIFPLINNFVSGWCSWNGRITLQSNALRLRSRGLTLKRPAPLAAAVLNILCHEEAHGSAYRGDTGAEFQMGLHTDHPDEEKYPKGAFRMINEAVTDLIGRRAFEEYLRRRRLVDVRDSNREIRASDWRDSYPLAHTIFDALAERIAHEFEVPHDVVENAFIRGAFEGANLMSDEMADLFKKSVSPEFYDNVQTSAALFFDESLSATIDFAKVAAELKTYEWSQAVRSKWRQLLSLNT